MKCDRQNDLGRLREYLNRGLPAEEQAEVAAHVASCPLCTERLTTLHLRQEAVEQSLSVLEPRGLAENPDVERAWVRFRKEAYAKRPNWLEQTKERIEMLKVVAWSRKWRPAAIGIMVALLLVGAFSMRPVREAAAEWLGVFRVRKFAVIPVDMNKIGELEDVEDMLDAGILGEPQLLRKPGEPIEVADMAVAQEMAGFAVRTPEVLLDDMRLDRILVSSGPRLRVDFDGQTAEAVIAAMDIPDVKLPEGDLTFEADFGQIVEQAYGDPRGKWYKIFQMPVPEVLLPKELDPAFLGEIWLQVLGLPEADVQRLAASIDWTSTLVLPLPTDAARYREVEIGGASGLLVETFSQGLGRGGAVIWQEGGLVYAVTAEQAAASDLLFLAGQMYR
jgi:hypothetical protein